MPEDAGWDEGEFQGKSAEPDASPAFSEKQRLLKVATKSVQLFCVFVSW